jgi:hypothetical protein
VVPRVAVELVEKGATNLADIVSLARATLPRDEEGLDRRRQRSHPRGRVEHELVVPHRTRRAQLLPQHVLQMWSTPSAIVAAIAPPWSDAPLGVARRLAPWHALTAPPRRTADAAL